MTQPKAGMKKHTIDEVMQAKAIEYSCEASDFTVDSQNRIIVVDDVIFKMITFGWRAVMLINKTIFDSLEKILLNEKGIFCFDAPQLCSIDRVLRKYGFTLDEIYDFYLPLNVPITSIKAMDRYIIEKISKEKIPDIRGREAYENALCTCEKFDLNEFAYVAKSEDEIVSIAAVSSNSEKLWWVGVDTLKPFRKQGLATHLVHRVSMDTLRLNKIPVYPTWYSNIASISTALNAGFRPGFVEISTREVRTSN